MSKKIFNKEDFVLASKEKFGDKFDYSKFEYINAKTKSTIICEIHGEFQQCPDKHLHSVYGCMKCFDDNRGKAPRKPLKSHKQGITKEEYALRVAEKHGDKFAIDFSEYKSYSVGHINIQCPDHGKSRYTAQAFLLSECGCRECGRDKAKSSKTKPYDDFLKEANIKHNFKYIYPESNREIYDNRKSIIEIECPIHGKFKKKGQKHLSGQGCYECRIDEMILSGVLGGGYNETYFNNNPHLKDKNAVLYYLKVGRRYKIGITTNLKSRIRSIQSMSKQPVDVIDTFESNLENVWKIEQSILNKFKENRISRRWTTELFDIDILNGSLSKEILS